MGAIHINGTFIQGACYYPSICFFTPLKRHCARAQDTRSTLFQFICSGQQNYEDEKNKKRLFWKQVLFTKMTEFININLPNVVRHLPAVANQTRRI